MKTAAAFLADLLDALDIGHVFGVPGQAVMPVYNELHDRKRPAAVLHSHETGAGFAANAWAQITGKVGVCLATTGPGALNLMTGLATGYTEGTPMLALTGQVAVGAFGTRAYQDSTSDLRGIDTVSAFRSVTKRSGAAHSADHLARLLLGYLDVARSGRPGPVHISVPWDIWLDEVTVPGVDRWSASVRRQPAASLPDPADVAKVAALLAAASRPLLLVGRGLLTGGRGDWALRAAERWDLPIVTTARGKGAVPTGHPAVLGHLGAGGSPALLDHLAERETDLLLAVGTSFGSFSIGGLAKRTPPPDTVVTVNLDAEERGALWPSDRSVVADGGLFLRALAERPPGARRPPVAAPAKRRPEVSDFPLWCEGRLHPGAALAAVRDALPPDARLLPDAGNHWIWAMHLADVHYSGALLTGRSLGAMGQGLAAAIGAALAEPDRPVVSITGDGCVLMHGGELAAGAAAGARVLWVVVNDESLGRIRTAQLTEFDERYISTTLPPVDYAAMAAAMGLWSRRVTRPEEIGDAVRAGLAHAGPAVVELVVGRTNPPGL